MNNHHNDAKSELVCYRTRVRQSQIALQKDVQIYTPSLLSASPTHKHAAHHRESRHRVRQQPRHEVVHRRVRALHHVSSPIITRRQLRLTPSSLPLRVSARPSPGPPPSTDSGSADSPSAGSPAAAFSPAAPSPYRPSAPPRPHRFQAAAIPARQRRQFFQVI